MTTDKTEYKVGEELDLSSLVLTVEYDNNTSEVINVTMDMVSGFDSSKPGTLEVTVTYKGKIATFTVNIVEEGPVVVTGELVGSENYPGYENWKDAITSEGIDFSKITKAQAIKMGINDPDYYGIALDLKVNGEVVELNTANLSKVERVKPNGEIETPIVTAEGTVQFVHDGWGGSGDYTMVYTLKDGRVIKAQINVVSFEFKDVEPVDETDPVIKSAEVVKNEAGDLVLTVVAEDENLYSLEVDHSHGKHGKWASAGLPEFTIYADSDNVWGELKEGMDPEDFGVTAAYDAENQTWTLTFGADGQVMGVINNPELSNGAVEFYLVAHDAFGNSSGDMDGNYEKVVYTPEEGKDG